MSTNVCIVKAMVFPVVICWCECWTIKKAKCRRTDALKLWCRKTPESLLDCEETKPVNFKGNLLWMFAGRTIVEVGSPILWPPDAKRWKIPDVGKTEDKSSRGWQKMRWLDDSTDSMNVNLCKLQVIMEDKRACNAKVHRVARSQRQCSYWKTTIWQERSHFFQHRQCCKLDTCKPKINKIKSWRW